MREVADHIAAKIIRLFRPDGGNSFAGRHVKDGTGLRAQGSGLICPPESWRRKRAQDSEIRLLKSEIRSRFAGLALCVRQNPLPLTRDWLSAFAKIRNKTIKSAIFVRFLSIAIGLWMTALSAWGQCTITLVSSRNVTCHNGNDGQIVVSASGGLAPYVYTITPNAGTQSPIGTFSGLTAGSYTINALDNNNNPCTPLPVTITQPANPLTITSQPLDQTDCYGNTVEFSVNITGSVGTVAYQWQSRPPSGNFSDIPGANTSVLTIHDIGVNGQNIDGTEYRVIVTDDCGSVTSESAVLHINTITDLTPTDRYLTICSGESITYTVFTQGSVVGYQWAFNNGTGWNPISDNANYSGTTSNQLVISNATPSQSGEYRVSVSFATLNQPRDTCIRTSTTRQRMLTVLNPLSSPVISSSQSICYNSLPNTLIATPASGGSNTSFTYQWQSSQDGINWTDIPAATSLTYSPPVLTATTHYRIIATDVGSYNCGSIESLPVTITVNELPAINLGQNPVVCRGITSAELPYTSTTGSPDQYSIDYNAIANSAGFIDVSNSQLTTSPILFTVPPAVVPGTYNATLTVRNSTTGCVSIGYPVTVTVNPVTTPTVTISASPPNNICAGTEVTFTANVNYGGTNPTYQWLLNGNPVGTESTYTSSALANGNTITLRVTGDPATITCPGTGTSNTITMTVNEVRQHSVTITASANNICPGNQVTFTAFPINGGTSPAYTWYLNDIPVANTAIYSSATLNDRDRIYVETTSNTTCPVPLTARSSTIEMTVRPGIPEMPGLISGETAVCPGTTGHIYSISDVTNATSYAWTVPTGWSIVSGQGTTTITVTAGNYGQNGNISVTASNYCGTSTARTLAVTVNPGTPAAPGPINGLSTVCPNVTGLTYSIENITYATEYQWTVPAGWNITSGQGTNTITVTSGGTGQNGNITVRAVNSCGISTARDYAVTVGTLSEIPSGITVTNNNTCFGTSKTLTVNGGSLGTGAQWQWYTGSCGGTSAGSGVPITVNPPAGTTTTYYVRAEGQCNTTECISADVVVLPAAPVQPGVITGPTPVCPGTTGLTYSIESVAAATSYAWSVPAGWTITSGQGTTSITVTAGNYGQNGNISVVASNSCGDSPSRTLPVVVSPGPPATPGTISGATEQCINRTGLTYSVASVQYATSYTWSVPDGWTITSGQGTNSITVSTTAGATSGNITVYASNSCGDSNISSLTINVITTVLSAPGPINGLTAICPARTTTYSIDPVPGVSGYTWTVPSGWNITSGLGTNSITVDVPINAQGGNVTVTADNPCGSSQPSALTVSVATTATVYAGPDRVVCYGTASVQLNGEVGGALRPNQHNEWDWIALSGGSFSSDRILNPIYYFPNGGNTTGTLTVRLQSNISEVGCPYTSDDMLITILPIPTVNDPVDQVVCNGSATSAVNFTGTGTSYSWTNNNTSIGLAASGNGNIPSFTATNSGNSPITATITVTPVNSLGGTNCTGTPQTFNITVNPTPTVIDPNDQVVCNGALTSVVSFTGTATSYTWTNNNTSIGLAASGTGNIPSFTATNTGNTVLSATITVTPVYSNAGINCSGTPQTFTISVNPSPSVDDPSDQVVCNGTTTTAINFTGISTSFTWTNDNTSIGLAATGTGNISPFTAINTGTTPQIANITVTPVYSLGGTNCIGTPQTFNITVNPTPTVIDPNDQVVCNGALTSVVSFTGTATSYTWTNNNTSIGLAASGTGNIPSFTATNTGNTVLSATITVT
ncbi:MAG: SprB repeat-containing protein, partial [Bacteroidales bacterium]|nr:SprB repeat-containing protein [Bacteroidales bacterium]